MKKRYYIACMIINKNIIAKNITKILYKNMWRIHNLSNIIISNRDPQFASII